MADYYKLNREDHITVNLLQKLGKIAFYDACTYRGNIPQGGANAYNHCSFILWTPFRFYPSTFRSLDIPQDDMRCSREFASHLHEKNNVVSADKASRYGSQPKVAISAEYASLESIWTCFLSHCNTQNFVPTYS